MSRLSCRPLHLNVDRFHQPCLLPWRIPLLPPIHGWLLGRDRWGLSVPRTTWRPLTLFGKPGSPSFASHWRFLPRRLDGTTAGCSFILLPPCVCHPWTRGVCTHAGSGPSQARRRLLGTCFGDPSPWPGLRLFCD